MKARIIERNGEKLRVSINERTRTITFWTYYKDGRPCGKYRATLDKSDLSYYPDYATPNDWFHLFRNCGCYEVRR